MDDLCIGQDDGGYEQQLEDQLVYAREEIQQLKQEVERLKDLLMV